MKTREAIAPSRFNLGNFIKKRKRKESTIFNRTGMLFANLMVSIALIHFCIWYLYLNYQSFVIAFNTNSNGSGAFTLIHFQRIIQEFGQKDTILYNALGNTFKYFAVGLFKLVLSYLIAYFFYKKVYGHKIFRFIFFLPSIISATVIITVFKEFISPIGPIGQLLNSLFGYTMPPLLSQSSTATNTIIFFVLWAGFGIQFMTFVGAMNRIPQELFESGKLDGCSWFREIYAIVLPLTWETFMTYLLLSFTGIFMASGPILFFTGLGNTFLNTYTINFYIYDQTVGGSLNYPAAIGLFFSACTVPFVVVVRILLKRMNKDITY